ncbi:uncharacterized protein LOC131016677 [Salvia miltiorrhiza]|uniref:uncharacterized protein LOC131016677 n=1 Tax=Salvia miltiorrhiza TaxID=226208 RepID=UPI0025AD7093|nr:uncharacterized protein LOC131016677 [Salvia miltiorrhiza]
MWRITNLTLDHSCYTDLDRRVARQVTAKVAASYFARRLVDEGCVLRLKEMIDEMLRLHGIKMMYSLALRTRSLAIDMTNGDFEKSYQRIPSYLYLLRERNPETIYNYQTTHEDVFLHMFVAIGQCIRAFESSLRPIIVVDGTHLKGRNRGVLFVVVTKDGNEQIFPLAIGLGPIENDESWTWFLSNLRRCYNPPKGLMIVSDQHKSIENAIRYVYPNAAHGLCYHHLHKNLTRIGKEALIHFKNAAYAYRVEGFGKFFSELELQSHSAHTRLSLIGVERWARSRSPVPRYSFMTSNAAETLNSRLLWARRLPVSSLLETFRTIVEKWFDERRASAMSRQHELTEPAYNKLAVQVELSHHLRVRARLNVYDFVSGYFKTSNLIETYEAPIRGISHPDDWNVPSKISSIVVQPPAHIRQSGHPSMSRARTAFEDESIRRWK